MQMHPLQPDLLATARRKLSEGKRALRATLSAAESAALVDYMKARSEAFAVKREAKRQRRIEISEMVIAGDTPTEISAKTGLSLSALFYRRAYWGLPIVGRKGFRRLFSWLSDLEVEALDALAGDMGLDRAKALAAVIGAALADDAFAARRSLAVRRKAVAA